MNETNATADLMQKIANAAGTAYLNRAHRRSFSLNVFQMNALALIDSTQRIRDPGQGMALMAEKNHEAGLQAHRELNRHIHNFVSSALTLVEHTRVFMREHYEGSSLLAVYNKQVVETFAKSPVSQFVQGLRNYMLHKGLPDSSMFMEASSHPTQDGGAVAVTTGIRFSTTSLLVWDKWNSTARIYLEQTGPNLDPHEFAQEYLSIVNQFHGWLDGTIAAHHRVDLGELQQLQNELQAISSSKRVSSIESATISQPTAERFYEFTLHQSTELNQLASEVFGKIQEIRMGEHTQSFKSERPRAPITQRDMIGPMTAKGQGADGKEVFGFIEHDGKSYGLRDADIESLISLIDTVMKSAWARSSLSRHFVETQFCEWARQRFVATGLPFSKALSIAARKNVNKIQVWAPIAHLEVEHGFDFGDVRIESITTDVIALFRTGVSRPPPEYEQLINQAFDQLRADIQGFSAVVIPMEAEPSVAQERALQIAQDAVSLLRFFSTAAATTRVFSPVALMGAEYIPSSKLVILQSEGGLITHEEILPKNIEYWRLSTENIRNLKSGLLDKAGSLLSPDNLNEFSLAVRASIITYSKGITFVDPLDRLRSCISALEGVLLKHEMEPRSYSIASRVSYLLSQKTEKRESIKSIIHKIYWLQDQPQLTAQHNDVDNLLSIFTHYAYNVLSISLINIANFTSKSHFVIEVDRAGLSAR